MLQDKMKGVVCVLVAVFCMSGAQRRSCPSSMSPMTRYATDEWQDIKSPNYGVANYQSNTLCEWTIQSRDPTKRIIISVVSLELEPSSNGCYDYIQISDDYSSGDTYCRAGVPLITSRGMTVYLKFYTDSSNTYRGFHLQYRLRPDTDNTDSLVPIQTCLSGGLTLQAQSYPKYITSPNYPENYPDDTECEWTLQAMTSNFVVKIVVEDSELEFSSSCSWDYVAAYDGSGTYSTQLDKWCGTRKPTLYSSGSSLTLKFHSDGSSNRRGFQLSYQEIPESERVVGLSTGAIIGIVVGVIALLVVLSICCCCCCCSTKNKPAVPIVTNPAATRGVGGAAASVTMSTAGSQVFFTTTTCSQSTGQMTTDPYSAAYAPPAYPGPAQPTFPPASAPTAGFSYPQPYGYPPHFPTSTAGNPYVNQQQSIPSEPPPPYWMASQYELQPGQQPKIDVSGADGQNQQFSAAAMSSAVTDPAPGVDTPQGAPGSVPPAAARSAQYAPGGTDNRGFVADDV